MKRFLLRTLAAMFVIPLSSLSACAEVDTPKVLRQDIAVTLAPESHLLTGESTVVAAAGTNRIGFSLVPSAVIDRVTADGKKLRYTFAGETLTVELPGNGGQAVAVTVAYHATFNDAAPEHPVATEDPTYGVNGAITPQGVYLGASAGWYPMPQATPEKRTLRVTAPAGIEAVTAGRRTARSTGQGVSSSTWEEQRPVGQLSLSAGPYRIEERTVGNIELYTYFYPADSGLAARYLDAAEKYLRFYSDLFGPYPFEKFAVVENFFPTGYGFPSYTLLGSAIIRLPFIIDTSFPHEIAHNWWGNGVIADDRQGNWSEGLVTYLADYLLKEKRSSGEGRDYRIQLLNDYAALVPPERDFPLQAFTGRVDAASRAIGYGKGAMLFHMVRAMIGDKAFYGALRDICQERMYRAATWSDFTRAFSRRSGKDLASFMDQWLVRTGGPRLALADVARRRSAAGWEVSGTIVQTPPFYQLSVPLRVDTGGNAVLRNQAIAGERTPFSITLSGPPTRLLLDPEAELFRLLSMAELAPTVNRIKGAEKLLVVRTQECRATDGTLRQLLESLGQNTAPVVPEDGLDISAIREHDLLFCGVPRDPALLALPAGTAVTPREFSISGERFSGRDDLLFLALKHPHSAGRVAALFLPLSPEAGQYALKVTHYGKYGYLVFSGGRNVRKGMFPPATSVNSVEFSEK
jgi:aminopeptidase N